MNTFLLRLFSWWLVLAAFGTAFAQTPNPVTPGYQICSNASGSTRCSFQAAGTDNVLGTYGLPVSAVTVATCGAQALTAAVPNVLTIDVTGTLCTSLGSGGITAAVTIANGADVTQGAIADAAATPGSTGTSSAKFRLMTTQLNTLNTTLGTPFQVGGAIAALPAGTSRVGYTSDDPCTQKTKTNAAFTTSSAGPVSIVALSGSTVVYVCSISAIADTAIKLSFIGGTGGSCASAQAAIWGSTTAANGMSLPANGGWTQGSGNGTVGLTAAGHAFCLLQSGTSLIAGNITYVQQ